MKKFYKVLSMFLCVVMIVTVIPMGVYAAETEEITEVQVEELIMRYMCQKKSNSNFSIYTKLVTLLQRACHTMFDDYYDYMWLMLFLISVTITSIKFIHLNSNRMLSLFTSIVILVNLIIQLFS